jgi:phosphoglycolate phosphatase
MKRETRKVVLYPKIEAVIFDLDGTLLDTIEDIAGTTNQVLGKRGLAPFRKDDVKLFIGDGIDTAIRRAYATRGVPSLSDEVLAVVVEEYRREYQERWRIHSRPYAGIPELLSELARRDIRMAVLTNKSQMFTTLMTAELLPGCPFDSVRGAFPGVPLKPDPTQALAIASELGIPPAHFAFLGDTSVDMKTALAAGMYPVGALWGFRTAGELRRSGAAALIASPAKLLDLL